MVAYLKTNFEKDELNMFFIPSKYRDLFFFKAKIHLL